MAVVLRYLSGEEIKAGDQILFHGEAGEVEFVATELTGDAERDWFLTEFGGGVMVREPKYFGEMPVFLSVEDLPETEDLEFVARRKT